MPEQSPPGRGPQPPLAPIVWSFTSALLLSDDAAVQQIVRDECMRHGSGDLDRARTADEALDMIGAASRPYDVVMLGGGRLQLESIHVLTMLVRQRSPSVAFGYYNGMAPSTTAWKSLIGLADWLNLRDGDRWPRHVARGVEAGASIAQIVERRRVPWHLQPALARAIYGADPGQTFSLPS